MNGQGRVLVVDDAANGALEGDSQLSPIRVGSLAEALFELAASTIDCVVVDWNGATAETQFWDAVGRRDDVEIVLVGAVERATVENESAVEFDAYVRIDDHTADLAARIRDLLDAGIDMRSEPTPSGGSRSFEISLDDGTIADVSEIVKRVLGYEPERMIGDAISSHVHDDDRSLLAEADEADDPETSVRFRHRDDYWRKCFVDVDSDDESRWHVSSRAPVDVYGDYDATEILEVLVEHVPIHLFVKDREGRHLFVSDFVEDQPGKALGRRDIDFDWGSFGRRTYEDDMQVVETATPIINEEEYVDFEDEWNLTSKVPWIGADGSVKGLVGVSRRITKRKEYQQELERQNRRLDQFASILSHDLRSPVNVASGHLELAREADDPTEHLDAIGHALERMSQITDDVLTMTRDGQRVKETEPVSLSTVASEAWDMVRTEDSTLEVEGLTVAAEPDRLPHLFENLFRNALEHADGAVRVRVQPLDGRDGFSVSDDGPGVPEENRDQIFEPGFTTKDDGTGLGLQIVRQVVHAHGWTIECTESEDGGVRFEIAGVDVLD